MEIELIPRIPHVIFESHPREPVLCVAYSLGEKFYIPVVGYEEEGLYVTVKPSFRGFRIRFSRCSASERIFRLSKKEIKELTPHLEVPAFTPYMSRFQSDRAKLVLLETPRKYVPTALYRGMDSIFIPLTPSEDVALRLYHENQIDIPTAMKWTPEPVEMDGVQWYPTDSLVNLNLIRHKLQREVYDEGIIHPYYFNVYDEEVRRV